MAGPYPYGDIAIAHVPPKDGSPGRSVLRVTCRVEGCEEHSDLSFSGSTPFGPDVAAQKFLRKGWGLTKRGQATCPKHKPARRRSPSSDMPRETRRLIFREIDSIYREDMTGYTSDWTDAKVADFLRVKVSWVAQVREADFGPDRNEAEAHRIAALTEAVDDMRAAVRDENDIAARNAVEMRGKVDEFIRASDERLRVLEDRLDEIAAKLKENGT